MILLALLAATAQPPHAPRMPHSDPVKARFDACVAQGDTDPKTAIAAARTWAGQGGGVPAGQCLGLVEAAAGDWKAAADAFATTADLAQQTHDLRAADLWVSSGNAALAGGDATAARVALDKAIAIAELSEPMRGEAYLDRARADVALDELPAARTDMDAALKRVPADPMAWLLSATLARRAGDTTRAQTDIHEAANRAPNEPAILYETGNIAAAAGDMDGARTAWARARAADPRSDAGQAAEKELAATGGVVPAGPAAPRPGR